MNSPDTPSRGPGLSPATAEPLRDRHGRRVEYIRVSLTERCNFRCAYCMPAGAPFPAGEPLEPEELLRLCRVFASLGVDNFKLTGGEPFMNPAALDIMAGLKALAGVRCVTVTTNGSTLDRHAPRLAELGVDGVNVSLDAMRPETFAALTGGAFPLGRILDNILAAHGLGLRVKLNMVPMRGVNEADIVPLLEFALERGISIRFIELMPLGQARRHQGLPQAEVRRIIEQRFGPVELAAGRFGNGPAVYYSLPGRIAKIGYIAAVSQRFCSTCNRIRLSAAGFLRTCLHHGDGAALLAPLRRGESDAELANRIRAAVLNKPAGHCFESAPEEGGDVAMFRIGG